MHGHYRIERDPDGRTVWWIPDDNAAVLIGYPISTWDAELIGEGLDLDQVRDLLAAHNPDDGEDR